MKIYNKNNAEIYDIAVDDTSVRYRSIMTDDSLTLNFSLTGAISVPQFSYVNFEGQRYTLWRPGEFKKHNTRNHEYTLTLHGYREFLKFVKYKDTSAKPYRLKFSLTAKPAVFLKQLVDCLNLKDSGWTVGDCIDAPEKTLSFNHEFCIDVLGRMSQEWNTEFEFDGKKVHFRKVEKFKDAPLALSYGKGKGFLPGVGRYNEGDKQPIGSLHVIGGERNIDFSKYGSRSLLLPKSATLVYEGKTYRTDADGMFITRDGNNLVGEDSYDGAHFYPHRVGTVGEVVVVDAEKHFYDVKDSSIPETLNYRDCRIKGEKAVIKFESGALAGREFDIEQTDSDLTGYIHAERRFKIVPAEIDGVIMPGGAFVPAVGDKYAIFNINLPQAYISDDATKSGASWEMFREAVRYFAENETDKFRFTGELDGVWSKSKWLEIGGKITPGGYVLFSDEQFQPAGVVIRIVAVKDYVNKPHKPEITLSNAPISGSFSSGLAKLEADEVVIEESKKEVLRFSKRQWRDARETMELLEKTMLNFSGSINPLTVQTMQLIAGGESLQFRFVNSKTNPVRVDKTPVFNKQDKKLSITAGILQHMTLGITTLTNAHKPAEYRYWDLAAYTSPSLTPEKPYYLYARCAKSGGTAVFLLSETAIAMEAVSGQYHFLVGILNSEVDGDRSFAPLYGFSEILPGRITTDKIISQDGKTYFDLLNGIIGGRIKFISTSGTDEDLGTWASNTEASISRTKTESIAAAKLYTDAESEAAEIAAKAYADGKVTAEEQRAINDANAKLAAAKAYADAKDAELKTKTDAYADGVLSEAERRAIAVAEAKSNAARIAAEAHADGKITAEEQRAINDANAKLAEAKAHAAELDAQIEFSERNLIFGGIVNGAWGQASFWVNDDGRFGRTAQVLNLEIGANYIFKIIKKVAEPVNDWLWVTFFKSDNTYHSAAIKSGYEFSFTAPAPKCSITISLGHWTGSLGGHVFGEMKPMLVQGNKPPTIWAEAPEDVQARMAAEIAQSKTESIAAAKLYTDAESEAAEIAAKAHADRIVTVEEQRAIDDANAKLAAAKNYADAKDAELKIKTDAYADDVLSEAERRAIAVAEAKSNAARVAAEAHADGKITAEEQRAINDANAKLAEAKAHAAELDAQIEFSERNLIFGGIVNGAWGQASFWVNDDGRFGRTAQVLNLEIGANYIFKIIKKVAEPVNDWLWVTFFKSDNTYHSAAIKSGYEFSFTAPAPKCSITISLGHWTGSLGGHVFGEMKPMLVQGNKPPTIWTEAPEDVQARIDAEKTRINEILSDNIADPSEKQYLSNLWQEIYAEYPRYWAQANSHGVDYSYYVQKYDALNNILSPVLANLTVNSTVSGASIRTAFNQYYDARAVLINAITNKVNSTALSAQQKANDADAKAVVAAAKTQYQTEIEGGLIYTALMKLVDVITKAETAGISGIQGANKDNPSFWSGGTYSQAFALINFLLKMSQGVAPSAGEYANLAPITMLHNGAAKIGAFIVERNGRIVLADPATGKARLVFNVMDIPAVSDLMNNTVFSGTANIGSGSTSSNVTLSGSTNVTQNGALASVGAVDITISASGQKQASGAMSFASAVLYARRGGVRYLRLAEAQVMFTELGDVMLTDTSNRAAFQIGAIEAGLYTFELVVEKEGSISSVNASVSSTTFSWEFRQQNVRYFQFGLNGMMAFFSDNHIHFTEANGFDVRGKTNTPGVLAAGSSTSGGTQTNVWGAKSNPGGVSIITGGFRVPLSNMEHSSYMVQITPHTSTTFRVGAKTATYFEIFGTGGFDYTVVGKNYT